MDVVWQFSTESNFSSLVIRYGTRSDWSHVDAVLPNGSLLGSRRPDGVQIRAPDYVKFSKILRVGLQTNCGEKFYDILKTQIGKPYDWRAITAWGLGDRDWRSQDSWFCSELQVWAMEQTGFFDRPLLVEPNRISPRDQLLLFSPWLEIIHCPVLG